MNLPFVIDVAVGLIFIFLMLSLLASEIQELLTTLLQWRAKHLKNSIEILLAGGVGTQQEDDVRDVVQRLYDDPLIKNINQEAKGWWASKWRAVTRLFQSSFGKNQATGPSYIAPETFATSLLERVGLADLSHTLVEVRLQAFAVRIIGLDEAKPDDERDSPEKRKTKASADPDLLWEKGRVRQIAEKANQPDLNEDSNFQLLAEEFNNVLEDFEAGETSLATAVERMEESFDVYINSYPIPIENGESSQTQDSDLVHFVKRLKGFKLSTFGNKGERAIKSGGLRPSLLEIAELADKSSDTYREITNNYKRLIVEGKKLDKIVLPRLKDELLTTHIEVIESQLTVKHLAEIEDQLRVKHSGVIKAFEKKLKANSDKLTKHLTHVKPVSLRRHPRPAEELEIKSPSLDAKFGQALTCPIKPVSRRRSLFRLQSWFAYRRKEGVFTLRQLKQLKQERQQIVTDILDRLPETDRQELVASILDKLSKPNSEELYGDIEKGRFGLIDCVLDRLPDGERCFLARRVLTALGQEQEWSEKFEKEQRSLYKNYQAYKTTQQILEKLPNATKESLVILARRAQTRVQQSGNDIDQFREEVAVWFDHSMSRASGVYKRNARGVGFLIGLLLVVATNVDVGFIVDRLGFVAPI